MNIREHELLIVDGACGTNLQEMDIPLEAWQGKDGCNELLNLTFPEAIENLHRDFAQAGAMILETNTFGASRIVLEEYDLADQVVALNQAGVACARKIVQEFADTRPVYIGGSIGPGTKLPSLGHITVEDLASAYEEQIVALVEAGVDVLIVETCQDLLQVKTAMIACFSVLERLNQDIPVMVSVTIESSGTMLVGSDIATVVATLAPFPLFSLGLNCATGPAEMKSHVRYLSQNWPGRISCVPNQGLPEVRDGHTCYALTPEQYGQAMQGFVQDYGVSIVGGCCGTTPAHTKKLVEMLAGLKPMRVQANQGGER